MCNETLWCIHVTTVAVQHNSALFFFVCFWDTSHC